jgi:hypothetical protein
VPFRSVAHVGSDGTFKDGPTWNVGFQTTAAAAQVDELWYYSMRRNGNAAAARMQHQCGVAPNFHGMLDPNQGLIDAVLVYEEMIRVNIAAGTCEAGFGFFEHIVTTTIGDLVGVGFRAGTGTTNDWHCFLKDCPLGTTGNTVVIHDFDTGILCTDSHKLAIVIDGRTKTVEWYIDRTLVSSYTPVAPLDRMSAAANNAGPLIGVFAVVPALGDITVYSHAGGYPQVRLATYPVGGDPPPPSAGGGMWVSST